MSISKAVITGKVVRDPEKRFTSSNVAVTTFTINVGNGKDSADPNLVRIICWRNLADRAAEEIAKGKTVIVDGGIQISSYKDSSGAEKKVLEIEAVNFVVLQGGAEAVKSQARDDQFDEVPPPSADDFNITSDDLIDEDEIPF